jgi:hypothetical protein
MNNEELKQDLPDSPSDSVKIKLNEVLEKLKNEFSLQIMKLQSKYK